MKRIDAQEALKLGLVHDVVSLERLENEAQTLAVKLSKQPAIALRAAKTAIYGGLNMALGDGLKLEQSLFCMLFGTRDQKEGMSPPSLRNANPISPVGRVGRCDPTQPQAPIRRGPRDRKNHR